MNTITLVLQSNVAEDALTRTAGAPFMASTSQAPETARKAPLIALAVAVTSPTKEQTEGAYREMHLKHNYCLSMEIVPIEHRWGGLLHLRQAVYRTQLVYRHS